LSIDIHHYKDGSTRITRRQEIRWLFEE